MRDTPWFHPQPGVKEGCFVCCSLIGACFAFPWIPWILAANPSWGCRFNIPALPAEPVVIRGAFYDGGSSFPSKINKSPRAFGIFIWASKSHFISPSAADPPSTPAFLFFPGFLVALCAGHRGWSCSYPCLLGNDVEKIFPFPSEYRAGEKGNVLYVSSSAQFVVFNLSNHQKFFSFPPQETKIQIYSWLCGFIWFLFQVIGLEGHFWECKCLLLPPTRENSGPPAGKSKTP